MWCRCRRGGASHTSPRQPHPASRSAIAVRCAVTAGSLTRHVATQPVRFSLARSAVLCRPLRGPELRQLRTAVALLAKPVTPGSGYARFRLGPQPCCALLQKVRQSADEQEARPHPVRLNSTPPHLDPSFANPTHARGWKPRGVTTRSAGRGGGLLSRGPNCVGIRMTPRVIELERLLCLCLTHQVLAERNVLAAIDGDGSDSPSAAATEGCDGTGCSAAAAPGGDVCVGVGVPTDWLCVVWARGFSHPNLGTQRLVVRSFLQRDWWSSGSFGGGCGSGDGGVGGGQRAGGRGAARLTQVRSSRAGCGLRAGARGVAPGLEREVWTQGRGAGAGLWAQACRSAGVRACGCVGARMWH
eukprot:364306-Chlamydomonas_euryale.AAC.1